MACSISFKNCCQSTIVVYQFLSFCSYFTAKYTGQKKFKNKPVDPLVLKTDLAVVHSVKLFEVFLILFMACLVVELSAAVFFPSVAK